MAIDVVSVSLVEGWEVKVYGTYSSVSIMTLGRAVGDVVGCGGSSSGSSQDSGVSSCRCHCCFVCGGDVRNVGLIVMVVVYWKRRDCSSRG